MTQEILINTLCPFFGTVGFAMLYNVPRKYYLGCGATGMFGWLVYLLCVEEAKMGATFASFFGTLVVVLLSRLLTVWMKCPITIFLVSGIFPLIPGAGVYNTVYYLVTDQMHMASYRGMEAVKIAFAIVIGIVSVVSIPREFFSLAYWKNRFVRKVEEPK